MCTTIISDFNVFDLGLLELTLPATSGYLSQQKTGDRRKANPDVKQKNGLSKDLFVYVPLFRKKHTFAGLPLFWLTRFAPCSI